jgi:hypothetical protein
MASGKHKECDCTNCRKPKPQKRVRPHSSEDSKRPIQPQVNPAQKYIDLLYKQADSDIRSFALEFVSDSTEATGWESKLLNPYLKFQSRHQSNHSFEPRDNEVVLVYHHEMAGLRLQKSTQYIKAFSDRDGRFCDWPKWEAARVIGTPRPGEITLQDLQPDSLSSYNLDRKAKYFTLEVMPSGKRSNSPPRIIQASIDHIRPFWMLRELQHGQEQCTWQPNIMTSAQLMSRLSLAKPWAFLLLVPPQSILSQTKYLAAEFRCRDIWIGVEKFVQGDAVRIMREVMKGNTVRKIPRTQVQTDAIVDQVLVIENICYIYEHLEAPSPTGKVHLRGKYYTTSKPGPDSIPIVTSHDTGHQFTKCGLPKSMQGYTWYWPGVPDAMVEISPHLVVGRCYERYAMEGLIYSASLSIGLQGVTKLRKWAMSKRFSDYPKGWIWATVPFDRDVVNLSNLDVGRDHNLRCRYGQLHKLNDHSEGAGSDFDSQDGYLYGEKEGVWGEHVAIYAKMSEGSASASSHSPLGPLIGSVDELLRVGMKEL